MQNMQKYRKYAEYDLRADFAGDELVDSPGVERWLNCVEHKTNNFVPHVLKPPAIDFFSAHR